MAIYHFSPQIASRSAGKSAVAMAAYRSGERLIDERTGEVKHYRRELQPETAILAPDHAPKWVHDRQQLWNEVEKIEKRKDSQLCREINIALPVELTKEQQQTLLANFVKEQFVDQGMVADMAIHRDDPNNPHAHVMLTMRPFNPDGSWGDKAKLEYILDDNGEKIRQKSGGFKSFKVRSTDWDDKETLLRWREQWATHSNRALERAGVDARIDHRSFEAQGITDKVPTIHEGTIVREMESRGIATDRGAINQAAKEHNATVVLLAEYRREKESLQRSKELLHPEERKTLRQAAEILGKPVTLKVVRDGLEDLKEREQGLLQQEQQLLKQREPFEQGEAHFLNIQKWNVGLKASNSLSRAFDREVKAKHLVFERRISEARIMLSKLGFSNESQFEDRKEKVFAYIDKEQAGIAQSRQQMAVALPVLQSAEQLMQHQEVRGVAEQYRNVPGIQDLRYLEAQALQDVNQAAGRTLSVQEIRAAHKLQTAESQRLEQQLQQIRKNGERLHGADQWLEKNELQNAQLRKLFQPAKVKAELKEYLKVSERMLKEYGVTDRKDYNRQLADQQQAERGAPALEGQISSLQPGLNLLRGALRALDDVGQRQQTEQQRQQWAKQHRGYTRVQNHDQEWER
ncbi:hypothetical protein BJP47_30120 [Paenibacillus odorifer]|nr:hypothetical protein BJP47_30120 [Paenibacillus odorifer]